MLWRGEGEETHLCFSFFVFPLKKRGTGCIQVVFTCNLTSVFIMSHSSNHVKISGFVANSTRMRKYLKAKLLKVDHQISIKYLHYGNLVYDVGLNINNYRKVKTHNWPHKCQIERIIILQCLLLNNFSVPFGTESWRLMSTKVPRGYRVALTAIYLAGHEEQRIGRVRSPIGTLPHAVCEANVTFIKGS